MNKTRRKGDRNGEELSPEIRSEIKKNISGSVKLVRIIAWCFVAFTALMILTAPLHDEDIEYARKNGIMQMVLAILLKYIMFIVFDIGMFMIAKMIGQRSVDLDTGNFTYRIAKVLNKYINPGDDDSSASYHVICEDEEYGAPENRTVDPREYKQIKVGGYVYIIYYNSTGKITEYYVHHAKERIE